MFIFLKTLLMDLDYKYLQKGLTLSKKNKI